MRNIIRALALGLFLLVVGWLLVTAVARVREAADQTQCTNNLRQIGLALLDYNSAYQHFPRAAEPSADLPPERRLSWLISIAPYYEATDLYVRMDKKKGWDAEENRYLALTILKYLQCPCFPEGPPTSTLVPTHYIGMAGLGADAATLPPGDARVGFFVYDRDRRSEALARGHQRYWWPSKPRNPLGRGQPAARPRCEGWRTTAYRFWELTANSAGSTAVGRMPSSWMARCVVSVCQRTPRCCERW